MRSFSLAQGLAATSDTIAFQYNLANGVSGVARIGITGVATAAPEPASVAFALAALPIAGAVVRRRTR